MSIATTDLIGEYLTELCTGLRVPPDEAELILAEAEDHLRETAAAGLAVGMTEEEAQRAAVASFGPVRDVARAHRRRAVTAGDTAMAGWKLGGLLAATVGAGGIAAVLVLHTNPAWTNGVQTVPVACRCAADVVTTMSPAVIALPYEALAAGGLGLLAAHWLAARRVAARRLARRGTSGRHPLSPALTAAFFVLMSALLFAVKVSGLGPTARQQTWTMPTSAGSASTGPLVPDAVLAGCLAMAVGYGLAAARRRARRGPFGARLHVQCLHTQCLHVQCLHVECLHMQGQAAVGGETVEDGFRERRDAGLRGVA